MIKIWKEPNLIYFILFCIKDYFKKLLIEKNSKLLHIILMNESKNQSIENTKKTTRINYYASCSLRGHKKRDLNFFFQSIKHKEILLILSQP